MKLFISQPMKGKTNEEIEAERAEVISRFEAEGIKVEIIDSFSKTPPPKLPLCGISESPLSCWERQMLCTSARIGSTTMDAPSSMNAP